MTLDNPVDGAAPAPEETPIDFVSAWTRLVPPAPGGPQPGPEPAPPGAAADELLAAWTRLVPPAPPAPSADGMTAGPATVAAAGPAGGGAGAPGPRDRMTRLARRPVRLGVVTLVAAVLLGLLGWQTARAGSASGRLATQDQVTTVARDFGQALLTYDYRHLDRSRARVHALATSEFATSYDTAFDSGMGTLIRQTHAIATGATRNVFLARQSGDHAEAIVLVDLHVRSDAGTRDLVGSYVDLDLVRTAGQWRVSQLTHLASTQQQLLAPQGSQPAPGK